MAAMKPPGPSLPAARVLSRSDQARATWVAQSAKRPTLAQVTISWFVSSSLARAFRCQHRARFGSSVLLSLKINKLNNNKKRCFLCPIRPAPALTADPTLPRALAALKSKFVVLSVELPTAWDRSPRPSLDSLRCPTALRGFLSTASAPGWIECQLSRETILDLRSFPLPVAVRPVAAKRSRD